MSSAAITRTTSRNRKKRSCGPRATERTRSARKKADLSAERRESLFSSVAIPSTVTMSTKSR